MTLIIVFIFGIIGFSLLSVKPFAGIFILALALLLLILGDRKWTD